MPPPLHGLAAISLRPRRSCPPPQLPTSPPRRLRDHSRTPRPAPRAPHPPEQMVAANATYGWLHAYRDDPMFVTGLWETAADHLKELALDERCVQRWVPQGSPAG